jgi:hypothetical protein
MAMWMALAWLQVRAAAGDEPRAPLRRVTGRAVARAIERGKKALVSSFDEQGRLGTKLGEAFGSGPEALALLALHRAGDSVDANRLADALARVRQARPATVYARAMRIALLSELDPNDPQLIRDVSWLVQQQNVRRGGWGYGPGHPAQVRNPAYVDSRNTFLASFALARARARGAAEHQAAWTRLGGFWRTTANPDGGWGFMPEGVGEFRVKPSSYGTAVAWGIASLHASADVWVAHAAAGSSCPYEESASKALAWLDEEFTVENVPKYLWGERAIDYHRYLHAVARAGLGSGRREFGGVEWAPALARALLASQRPDGRWAADPDAIDPGDDDPITTALAMLTLLDARRPPIIARMAISNRPVCAREAASAARWYSRHVREASWTWVAPDAPREHFADAPLLWIDASGEISLDANAVGRLHHAMSAGTLVIVQGKVAQPGPNRAVAGFLAKLSKGWSVRPLDQDHPLYSARFAVAGFAGDEEVSAVGDGLRLRALVVSADLAGALERPQGSGHARAAGFVANAVAYATDLQGPRGRFARQREVRSGQRPRVVRHARVGCISSGEGAATCRVGTARVSELLARSLSIGLRPTPAPWSTDGQPATLVWMTGTEAIELTDPQARAVQTYLQEGGLLLVDADAGRKGLTEAMLARLGEWFGPESVRPIEADHPLMTGRFADGLGVPLADVGVSRALRARERRLDRPALTGVWHEGRLVAIVSPHGVASALLGEAIYNARMYAPDDALKIATNVVLWAITGG